MPLCKCVCNFSNLAGDETRVVLQYIPKVPGSDYINANYVDVSCYNVLAMCHGYSLFDKLSEFNPAGPV